MGRKEICASARNVNGSEQLSYWSLGKLSFLECSFMLNATPVTNAFSSYTWLNKCFFRDIFFYIPTTFLFYRLFDDVLMEMYSLCGRRGDKKTFQETKICGLIASKLIFLFKDFFCWAKKWIEYLIFYFLFILEIKKNEVFENVLEFRQ